MDASFGLENAQWFADGPDDAYEDSTFHRSRAHGYVAEEVKAVRTAWRHRGRQLRQTRIQRPRRAPSWIMSWRDASRNLAVWFNAHADGKGQALRRFDRRVLWRGAFHAVWLGRDAGGAS